MVLAIIIFSIVIRLCQLLVNQHLTQVDAAAKAVHQIEIKARVKVKERVKVKVKELLATIAAKQVTLLPIAGIQGRMPKARGKQRVKEALEWFATPVDNLGISAQTAQ